MPQGLFLSYLDQSQDLGKCFPAGICQVSWTSGGDSVGVVNHQERATGVPSGDSFIHLLITKISENLLMFPDAVSSTEPAQSFPSQGAKKEDTNDTQLDSSEHLVGWPRFGVR